MHTVCGGPQGRLPGGVPDSGNKEGAGDLGVSDEQVIQKAQAQLQREEAGLKKLPTDQEASSAPGTANHTAGHAQHAGNTQQAGSTAPPSAASTPAPVADSTAPEQYRYDDAAAAPQGGGGATKNGRSATALGRESSFVTPDRATSREVAAAEAPVPWSSGPEPDDAQHKGRYAVSEHQPNGTVSSEAVSPPIPPANGHGAATDRVSGDTGRGLPRKQHRPNKFLQCITCGAGRSM